MDIRVFKTEKRGEIKERRRAMDPADKHRLDERVRRNVLRLYQYRRARVVIAYVSTAIEVDTRGIIDSALAQGKRVALPRCVEGTRLMRFYLIRSRADLEKGSFGLMEPKTACEPLVSTKNSICLVPGLAYDRAGYRLGYGGGYYDRFLCGYHGPKIGVVYARDLVRTLPHGRYDQTVDMIASDRGFFYIRRRGARHAADAPVQKGGNKAQK